MDHKIVKTIKPLVEEMAMVGSRVTCKPAPADTDTDVLVLCHEGNLICLFDALRQGGFSIDGSKILDPADYLQRQDTFQSWSDGKLNFIITSDMGFYVKFIAATSVAKRFNLLDKSDRIALFQAVLYGNRCEDKI